MEELRSKFRKDFEEKKEHFEEILKRSLFEETKFDMMKDRKNVKYQMLLSRIRKANKEILFCEENIERIKQLEVSYEAVDELDKQYDALMKDTPKETKNDSDLATDLLKDLGLE